MLVYENQQTKISMYRGLYEELIPENNILRQMKETIDFSFVNKLLADKYVKYYGRPAKEPALMFKLIFLQFKDDLSDREVIDRASYDLSYKFFLDLDPEDSLPDASLLSVFRKTKLSEEDTLEELLSETVRQAIVKGVLKSNTIIIDATHTQSKSVTKSPTQLLQEITKKIRREIYTKAPEKSSILPEKEGATETLETFVKYTKTLIEAVENNTKNEVLPELVEAIEKAKKIVEDERINRKKGYIDEEAKKGYKS